MLNPVSDELTARLRAALPGQAFRDPEPRYFEEPRRRWKGAAGLVLAPATVEETAVIVAAAAAHRVAVIPYGGGTGLVGGQVADDLPSPILLSMERMRAVRAVYPNENVIVAEAGATLADIQ